MKAKIFGAISAVALLGAISFPMASSAGVPSDLPVVSNVHEPHIFVAHGATASNSTTSSPLTYHGGPVMNGTVTVAPIFWGTNTAYPTSKVPGLSAFYVGYGSSAYAGISGQYTGPGGNAAVSVSYQNPVLDSTRASSSASSVLNEVVNRIGFSKLSNTAYYPVYTDIPRGSATACAWHSVGSVRSGSVTKRIKFAFFYNLDNDPSCTSVIKSFNTFDVPTNALANVSAHELAEMITDPELNAWYDSSGYENGDKCAWNFKNTTSVDSSGSTVTTYLSETLSNSSLWMLQGEWSNSANSCSW